VARLVGSGDRKVRTKKKATVRVTCKVCGVSVDAPFTSPAAPMLTALEGLESKGWAYEVGFFSMLTGDHNPRCPECKGKKVEAA
jgi:hypothetical protein